MSKPVILTGLRSTNDLHIGNYFGAVLPLVDMAAQRADEYQVNLMVADLHTLTTPFNPGALQQQIKDNLRYYAAAGLPLDKTDVCVYRQSFIPAHSELTWILDCFTGMGEMNRMTQFKDKSAKLDEVRISVGLYNYPVLMACDILLYGASYVPVGDDQSQHLEFTRNIAERLNSQYGELLVVPRPVKEQHSFFGKDQGLRIKDLVDPTKKMSKSDDSGKGVIFLSDAPEVAAQKIKSATTDSFGKIDVNNPEQPGIQNLLQILALIQGKTFEEAAKPYQGQELYGSLKAAVADAVGVFLLDFQKRLSRVDEAALMAKLEADEAKMNEIANATLYKVQKAVGLR